MTLPVHPVANMYPMMDPSQLQELAEDIRLNGQIEEAWVYRGQLLDGRNRAKACEMAGRELRTTEPPQAKDPAFSPTRFVLSVNSKRRHLTPAQKASVAAIAKGHLEREAKERQRLAGVHGKEGGRGHVKPPPQSRGKGLEQDKHAGESLRIAAKETGAGRTSTEAMVRVREADPRIHQLGMEGKVAVADAVALVALAKPLRDCAVAGIKRGEKPREAIRKARKAEMAAKSLAEPSGKYRVIYADPPWQYGDERTGLTGYESTAAEDHYPTMPTDEICKLSVRDWVEVDAVLFCWATFPLLTDALDVVKAWGFKYKTAFVWSKGRSNMGNYHDASCELLLVATRGSCTPDAKEREGQLQSIVRGRHSAKPEEFRAMIDKLYRYGRKLEMFRRGAAPDGWDIWGNEAAA